MYRAVLQSRQAHQHGSPYRIGDTLIMPKTRRNSIDPRPLTERELTLIAIYSYCQLKMTPQEFYAKWDVTYPQIAVICHRSLSTVRRWFKRGDNYYPPTHSDLCHLALMDFLLEHFEEIPPSLFKLLYPFT